jgi:hypothetical protein
MSHEPPDGGGGGDVYLWDRSGRVDAGVREVEEAARALRHAGEWSSVEAKSHGMRMAKVRALAAAAVVVLAVVGAWLMWPSGRITKDSGELSPWKFVAGRGVTVTRTEGDPVSGRAPRVRLVTDSISTVELRSTAGAVVTLGRGSAVSFEDNLPAWVPREPMLVYEGGELTVENPSDGAAWLNTAEGAPMSIGRGSRAKVWRAADGAVWIGLMQGTALAGTAHGKPSRGECALAAPMVQRLTEPDGGLALSAPVHPEASAELVETLEKWGAVRTAQNGEKARAGLVQRIAEIATLRDIGTLWNLAFELTYDETDREQLVAAIGRLTGDWPAVIKSTKEPPWSETFKDAWWDVVKRSYEKQAKKDEPPTEPVPPPPSDGKSKAPPVGKGGKK